MGGRFAKQTDANCRAVRLSKILKTEYYSGSNVFVVARSTYSECEPGSCVNGEKCSNMVIQRRQYAPGLERFMTAKKGWGVRARQSIAKSSFILEYTGEICSSAEFERRMLVRYKGDNHHYCLAMDNKIMIDAHRAGSECRLLESSPVEF